MLAQACEIAIEQGHIALIHGERLASELAAQQISDEQIIESQEVLEGRLYVSLHQVMGPPHVYDFRITSYGFEQFVQSALPNYGELCADVARLIVQERHTENATIISELQQPAAVVDHILESLKQNGLIKTQGMLNRTIYIFWSSPELKRRLES